MIYEDFKHLPLENAYNVRDLGGYPCEKGKKITKFHSFLRADDLHYLNKEDIDFLIRYGLTAVIDLRSGEEIRQFPDVFESSEKINYINIPLIVEGISDVTRINSKEPKKMMTEFYLALLKHSKDAIKDIFEYMAKQEKGTVLFHCTAGKDRTGVTAMLLLMLAGVKDADVIADYMVTHVYNSVNPELKKIMDTCPKELLQSEAAYIIPVIEYIRSEYNTVEEYLEHIGISKEVLNKVIYRLCG